MKIKTAKYWLFGYTMICVYGCAWVNAVQAQKRYKISPVTYTEDSGCRVIGVNVVDGIIPNNAGGVKSYYIPAAVIDDAYKQLHQN